MLIWNTIHTRAQQDMNEPRRYYTIVMMTINKHFIRSKAIQAAVILVILSIYQIRLLSTIIYKIPTATINTKRI